MIAFETEVRVGRPAEEVFAYVAEPLNFPQWNSAVQAVRKTSGGESEAGSTYVMERELPTGPAVNTLEIVARERPTEFAIRATSGPTPFHYRFRFAPQGGATAIHLDAEAELGGAADAFAPIVRRALRTGVDANLARVKAILESTSRSPGSTSQSRDGQMLDGSEPLTASSTPSSGCGTRPRSSASTRGAA